LLKFVHKFIKFTECNLSSIHFLYFENTTKNISSRVRTQSLLDVFLLEKGYYGYGKNVFCV